MKPLDALIVGVGQMGGACVAMFSVDRPDIPDLVQDFIGFHRTIMDDNPDCPTDPETFAHSLLMAAVEEMNDSCKHALFHAAVYFLGTHGKPKDLEGPTLIAVDELGVGSKPLDVRRSRE